MDHLEGEHAKANESPSQACPADVQLDALAQRELSPVNGEHPA